MAKQFASDYVEVAERLQEFYAKYPEGSLQGEWEWSEDHTWIFYKAYAYRSPEDPRPGIGHAQELVPGKTPYTRGSELMNAETSAWGRAMAALGIATKKGIATGHEVRMAKARQQETAAPAERPRQAPQSEQWSLPTLGSRAEAIGHYKDRIAAGAPQAELDAIVAEGKRLAELEKAQPVEDVATEDSVWQIGDDPFDGPVPTVGPNGALAGAR